MGALIGRPCAEESDDWHHCLLRPRSERPPGRSAANQHDELASPHEHVPQAEDCKLPHHYRHAILALQGVGPANATPPQRIAIAPTAPRSCRTIGVLQSIRMRNAGSFCTRHQVEGTLGHITSPECEAVHICEPYLESSAACA